MDAGPNESVEEPSNQQFILALTPARITLRAAASTRTSGTPCRRQTASRFAVEPPPTYTPTFLHQRAEVFAPLRDVVRRGQEAGLIRVDLPPQWIVTVMASILAWRARAPNTRRLLPDH